MEQMEFTIVEEKKLAVALPPEVQVRLVELMVQIIVEINLQNQGENHDHESSENNQSTP